MEVSIYRMIYAFLGVTLTVDVLLSLSRGTLYQNLSSTVLLVAPILIMVYIISTQRDRERTWKTVLIFLMLSLIFILEAGVFLGHGLKPIPLFNALSLLIYVGLFRVFSEHKEGISDIEIKRWAFGLSGFYIALVPAFAFLSINQETFAHFSNIQTFLVIMTLLLEFIIVVFSAMVLFKKFQKKIGKFIWAVLAVFLVVFGAILLNVLSPEVNAQLISRFLLLVQIVMVIALIGESIYTGLSNYFRSDQKLLLFVISVLPLVFLFENKFWGLSYLKEIFEILIDKLTWFAIFFSILTFIYYTLETILLWYAYSTKSYTRELSHVKIETHHRIIVLIPCMNEELVIKNTVKSLLNTNYENLDIYVIDDASIDNTVKEVEEFKGNKRFHLLQRFQPEAQQGKGEALNWAYKKITESYLDKGYIFEETLITIIDADSSVETDYFDKVNLVFNSDFELTGLQSKVQVINRNRDTSQDLEFGEIINATQSLRSKTNTVAFGGNGQFCKLSTLYSLHEAPWTTSLVEDFDLSLRLFLSDIYNVRNVQYDDIKIKQTGIYDDPMSLVKQRVRWAQGNIQTFKYVFPIIKSENLELKQKTELCFTLIKPWLMAIEYMVVIYTGIVLFGTLLIYGLTQAVQSFVLVFIFMVFYIFLINIVWAVLYNRNNQEKFKISHVLKDAYYLTKFLIILSQIYPQAIFRYFNSQNTWDKTKRQA
ncbi:glycosyltransferase [Lactococcus garvieae]|uniref:glycosyltransferase n=1 Tax=Lactococcus garvieae TaxID=1363 RepID=UPI0035A87865